MAVDDREWLEADGLGGFTSGTVSGRRTRKYHALLLTATSPPAGRYLLVNGLEAHVNAPSGSRAISSQHYLPNVVHPDGYRAIESFVDDPWPTWTYRGPGETRVVQEVFAVHDRACVVIAWSLPDDAEQHLTLTVRLLLSGRNYHAIHRENPFFDFAAEARQDEVAWRPYPGVPQVRAVTNGRYVHDPLWYRQFFYSQEQRRGMECCEDLASPGRLHFDLSQRPAFCVLTTDGPHAVNKPPSQPVADFAAALRERELRRRSAFRSRLDRSADAYLVRRGDNGRTVVAGYPWFTDWGRDTFIALRGLCLARGARQEARQILLQWAKLVSRGMLPNRFPEGVAAPEFNTVDASLWYVIAVHEYLQAVRGAQAESPRDETDALLGAVEEILSGYADGTRFGIRADGDGLLAAGQPKVQLTWMDAKLGDRVITPRIGKPVEVQALWINALWVGSRTSERWQALYGQARGSFSERFWNGERACLFDVVDVDHVPGRCDDAIRPNQIFAVGGLPLSLLDKVRARQVVQTVEHRLLTPLGLRTLDRADPAYKPHYEGSPQQRDEAYHQGTVWPWLMGPFVEAWLRVHGDTQIAARRAGKRFLQPLLDHLNEAGIGHVSEIADGDPPHTPRGCPFQAWSVGELIRALALTSD